MLFRKPGTHKKRHIVKTVAAAVIASAIAVLCGCAIPGSGEIPDDVSTPRATKGVTSETPKPENPVPGGTLKLSIGPYDTVNPLRTSNEDLRLFLCAFVCENLVDIGPDMQIRPGVITSWSVDDTYRVWELKVDNGVVFHSGAAAEAEDVKILIDNIIGFGGNYAENVKNVAGCSVADKETVQIILKEPDALFVNKLCIPFVGWQTLASDRPVVLDATGIFRTTEFDGGHILLEKNTLYRDKSKLTYYNTIDITVFESENAKVNSDFDICVVQGASVGANLLREGSKVYYYGGTGYDYIAVNCATTYLRGAADPVTGEKSYITLDNPFSEKKLRQALNYVTSRTEAVNKAASGRATISLLPLYSGTVYRTQNAADFTYSPEHAMQLLIEAGYERTAEGWFRNGEELTVSAISPRQSYRMTAVMRAAVEGLRDIGVRVELYELTDEDYLARLNAREYMIAAVEIELGVWQDCGAVFGTNGALNYSFYSDSRIDDYIAQTRLHSDPAVVAAAFARIEEIILDDCPIVGLFIADNALVTSGRIGGVREEILRPWAPLSGAAEWWIK